MLKAKFSKTYIFVSWQPTLTLLNAITAFVSNCSHLHHKNSAINIFSALPTLSNLAKGDHMIENAL